MTSTRPNILLIILDTVRAASCSLLGYERDTTPTLRHLAQEGKIFTHAISPAPWTLPAHASLFSGQYCFQHGVDGRRYHITSGQMRLPQMLREAGYATAGISTNIWISDTFGFQYGFDYFFKTWQYFQNETHTGSILKLQQLDIAADIEKLRAVLNTKKWRTIANAFYGKAFANRGDKGGQRATRTALRWLKGRDRKKPFFLFLNYVDPHAPFLAPEPYRQRFLENKLSPVEAQRLYKLSGRSKEFHMGEISLASEEFEQMRALYDAEIRYADAQVARIVHYLRQEKELDNTLLLITSDHGENIGDHGLMAHCFSVHQTLLHIPMLLRFPAAFRQPHVETSLVQLTDVLPTLLAAAGAPAPASASQLPGANLLEQVRASRLGLGEYLSTDYTPEARTSTFDFQASPFHGALRAFYKGKHKLIYNLKHSDSQLFDIVVDPNEQHDLSPEQPELSARLTQELTDFIEMQGGELSQSGEGLHVDRFVEERLSALGYIR